MKIEKLAFLFIFSLTLFTSTGKAAPVAPLFTWKSAEGTPTAKPAIHLPQPKVTGGYSLEAWVLPHSVGKEWNRILLLWDGVKNSYHLAIHKGKASLFHGQANGNYLEVAGGVMTSKKLHHLVGTANPKTKKISIFLDGKLQATLPYDGTLFQAPPKLPLAIGCSSNQKASSSSFNGNILRVAIFDRPLNNDEVQQRFKEGATAMKAIKLAAQANRKLADKKLAADRATRLKSAAQKLAAAGVQEIIFAERHPGRDKQRHYYANFGYLAFDPDRWFHAADGGGLRKLNVKTGELTTLSDTPTGSVRDPQLSYDGKTLLFSLRPNGKHHYNLFTMPVGGGKATQITSGDWDDVEPTWLPSGEIVFCSSRCKRWVGCWNAPVAVLFRCKRNGSNLRQLSSNMVTENTPAVLNDGTVLYTRWEYVNRDPVVFHHLWTINPDGTNSKVYYGNMKPGGVFIDAKPIPNSENVLFINSPGHGRNEHAGNLAIVTDAHGPDAPNGLRNLPLKGNQWRDPFPITDSLCLVATGNDLYLIEYDPKTLAVQEQTLLYHSPVAMVNEPVAVMPRKKPPVIPDKVNLTQKTATVLVSDVTIGRNLICPDGKPLQKGVVKKLLILEDLPKPLNYHGGGSQPIGHGVTSTIKRIIGTVPVESDGSAHFVAPANRSIYFAMLDEKDLSIKQMRSFVTFQPGESVACIGCHENRTDAPMDTASQPLAAKRSPSVPTFPQGVPEVPDYPRDIQPILNKHCVKCHGHKRRDGGLSLVGDRGPVFTLSYYNLYLWQQIKDTKQRPTHGTGRQLGNDPVGTTYSSASRLMQMLEPSHHDVKLLALEKETVRLWLDVSSQFAGTYAAYGSGQIGGCWDNNSRLREMADKWPTTPAAIAAVERRCGSCHPATVLPRHVTAQTRHDSWGDMLSWTRPLSRFSRNRLYNLTEPEQSLMLKSGLAKNAGGWATREKFPEKMKVTEDRSKIPAPSEHPIIFKSKEDADYQAILSQIVAAKERLDTIKWFGMPDFRPSEHYLREMQRYGVIKPDAIPETGPIDPYTLDALYWRSFW